MKVPVRLATVHRKRDKHAVAVMDHEIPILERMYGEGAVQIEDDDYDTREVDDSAAMEHARLVGAWASKNYNPVADVYPTPRDLERHGFTGGGGTRSNEREQSVTKDRRKEADPSAKPAAKKAAKKAVKKAASKPADDDKGGSE